MSGDHAAFYGAVAALGAAIVLALAIVPPAAGRGAPAGTSGSGASPRHRFGLAGGLAACYLAASLAALALSWDPALLRLGVLIASAASILFLAIRSPLVHKRPWLPLLLLVVLTGATTLVWQEITSSDRVRADAIATLRPKVFTIYGTCVNNRCGLNARTAPRQDAPSRGELLRDGHRITVLCQQFGGVVRGSGKRRSALWDYTDGGLWVSDLYVDTSKAGPRSRELDECPPELSE